MDRYQDKKVVIIGGAVVLTTSIANVKGI